jgi:putative membrane protein
MRDDGSVPTSDGSPTDPKTPPGAVDARFTLAAERTVLSWFRTALGLVAAGLAVMHVLPDYSSQTSRDVLGIGLVAFGTFAAIAGGVRWRQTTAALRDGGEMPGPLPVWLLIGALTVFSVFAVVLGLQSH